MTAKISERAVAIGAHDSLIGVVTQGAGAANDRPGVVALNGGILPRWGRARIYVSLARRIAPLGFRFLRFDLSGIGDSPSRTDGLSPRRASVADVEEALDWFVGRNGKVVLIGLCDGANLAAYQASLDERVAGAILIDPLIPRTRRYRFTHLWRRLWSSTTWREVISGKHVVWRVLRSRAGTLAGGEAPLPSIDPNSSEVRAMLVEIYTKLSARNVPVLALFSGGMQHRHTYREQIFDAFPEIDFKPSFEVEYFQANDHHFEWPSHRAWLLDRLTDWLTASFGMTASPPGEDAAGADPDPGPRWDAHLDSTAHST